MSADNNVPEIRFKGFSENWISFNLSQITDVYDGTHQTPTYTKSGVIFLSAENIKTLTSTKFISEEAFKKEFKIYPQKNDVLMTRIGDVGTANVVETDDDKAYYVTLALLKYKQLSPYFLKSSIASPYVQRDIWLRTLHIAFPKKINMNEIKQVLVNCPLGTTESDEIGNYFQKLDNLINQHQQKHDKLSNIKKAMLEKMFPKQGETVPEIRFKGFGGEWVQEKVVSIAPLQRGFDLPKSEMKAGAYPVVMSNGINGFHYIYKSKAPGIVTGRSGTIGNIHYIEDDYWPHNTALWVTNFNGNVPRFIYYLYVKLDLKRFGTGSGVPTLNRNDVHDQFVNVPTETEEQAAIGNYFQKLDTLINQHQQQITKLNNIKQACLSKMFV